MDSKQIRRLVAGTADAAFTVDVSGLISAWNTMAEELFGLSSTEAIGRGCHEILQGNDVRQPTTLELLDKSRSLCCDFIFFSSAAHFDLELSHLRRYV